MCNFGGSNLCCNNSMMIGCCPKYFYMWKTVCQKVYKRVKVKVKGCACYYVNNCCCDNCCSETDCGNYEVDCGCNNGCDYDSSDCNCCYNGGYPCNDCEDCCNNN